MFPDLASIPYSSSTIAKTALTGLSGYRPMSNSNGFKFGLTVPQPKGTPVNHPRGVAQLRVMQRLRANIPQPTFLSGIDTNHK